MDKGHIEDIISFLSLPGSFPDQVSQVEIIQTHASVLALTDQFVYKVKKPVTFEFMDFSTPEKRRFYCVEELRLNKRLTTGIYLGLARIYRDRQGKLSFEPAGVEVDTAVKMKRLNQNGFLANMLKKKSVAHRHFERIVEKLCRFYHQLPPQDINPEYGTRSSIAAIIRENQIVRNRFLGKAIYTLQEKMIADYQNRFLSENSRLFSHRKDEGWIRDTHGDLRIEHFHFDGEELNIYDCIEFHERLRVNDLVNDVAFLSMELEAEGQAGEARWIYEEIVKCTGDTIQNDLWLFYKVHRACVRGMVHAVAASGSALKSKEQQLNLDISRKRFSLAVRYAVLGGMPSVIVLSGGVATGKSTIARELKDTLFIPHIQSDVTRKELAGIPVDVFPDESERDELYKPEMTQRTIETMIAKGKSMLDQYNAVILDSRWIKAGQREMVVQSFRDCNIYWLRTIAGLNLRRERLRQREDQKSVSDARLDILDVLLKQEEEYSELEITHLILDTAVPIEDNMEKILKFLSTANSTVRSQAF